MHWRFVAQAACVMALAMAAPAWADNTLTLDDAFARVIDTHPDLRVYAPRHEAMAARVDKAAQAPPLTLGAEVENAMGTGDVRGLHSAEVTLSLSSVLERGGKREARRSLAETRVLALDTERNKTRLDLLAETARRYLAVVASRQQAVVARDAVALRQRAVAAADKRHRAGAVPASVVLSAEAALAQAELGLARAEQSGRSARRYLAALWGEHQAQFRVADADLRQLPTLEPFAVLVGWLDRNPAIRRFADRQRIAEARLQLAQTEAVTDIQWQVGVRRFQLGGDVGVVGSVSIPLGSASRAAPDIRIARNEIEALSIQREASGMALYATLADAHGRYQVARLEVTRLGADVLPRLAEAEQAAARAWRAGAATYAEWARLQSLHVEARQRQLAAALQARRALIEIQRLTARSWAMAADSAASKQGDAA